MTEWPRHIASRIAKLKTLDERRAALEKVPEQLRELVKSHLKLAWERKSLVQHAKAPPRKRNIQP